MGKTTSLNNYSKEGLLKILFTLLKKNDEVFFKKKKKRSVFSKRCFAKKKALPFQKVSKKTISLHSFLKNLKEVFLKTYFSKKKSVLKKCSYHVIKKKGVFKWLSQKNCFSFPSLRESEFFAKKKGKCFFYHTSKCFHNVRFPLKKCFPLPLIKKYIYI